MATITRPELHAAVHGASGHAVSYLDEPRGLKSWICTLDHKRIGVMYLCGIMIALIVGGAFALLLRTELWAPGKTIVAQDTYNQFFTLHGAVMVFLVIIPGIPAALGNIIMPIQLGAPDVAQSEVVVGAIALPALYLIAIGKIRAAVRDRGELGERGRLLSEAGGGKQPWEV